jgi:ABC-2 type transport system permease protein
MRLKWKLTVASLKMFFRQREAIIWTLLLPVFMILLFGLVDFRGNRELSIGIIRDIPEYGQSLVRALGERKIVAVHEEGREREMDQLKRGERALVLVLGPASGPEEGGSGVVALANSALPEDAELASLVVRDILTRSAGSPGGGGGPDLQVQEIEGKNLSYIDFLVPGVISMSIMQMGIFGVAFSFVTLKKRGILRRLRVTPVNPNDFILAQILTRLIVVILQISLLVTIGVLVLDVTIVGHLADMFLLGVVGAFVFLAIGFAIAGISKSEDQVAPLANVVAMPMILLSGVFFSRSNLPGLIHSVTDVLPLTYLADGMRAVALDGAGVADVLPDLGGLILWCVVATFLAIRFFRWE